MLIVIESYGNHSNRLFQNINFESICLEYNIDYCNPTFWNMAKYYKNPCATFYMPIIVEKTIKHLHLPLPRRCACTQQNSKENNFNFIISNAKNKLVFASGWYADIPSLIKKYQQVFIDKYTLKDIYYIDNPLYKKLLQVKNDGRIIIGIHIRRGDYKIWNDGKYYYSDEVYAKYMNKLSLMFQNCYFLIFSNEITSFTNNGDNILISNEKWYIDHFLMMNCHYIIGPPSTFTMWASYIGKVKYYHMLSADCKIEYDDFICHTG